MREFASLKGAISRDEVVAKLGRLVSIASVVENGRTEAQVVEEVVAWCREGHIAFEVTEVSPGRQNLLMEWVGKQPGPTLLYEAHSDTVTAGDPSLWTRPPFQLSQEGDRLYGRGTADTKGNLVAAYLGIRALNAATQGDFPGTIRLLVPVDEEGMMAGIRHYIASGGTRDVAGAICCEPEDAQICIRQKGALRLRCEIHGKMAHGAMPLTGNNPLPVLARFLAAVAEEEREAQQIVGLDPLLGWPSMTPTEIMAPINGPSGFNVVPGSAGVSLDVRTVKGQVHEDLAARLRGRLQLLIRQANAELRGPIAALREQLEAPVEAGEFAGRLIVLDDRPVTDTPIDHPLVQAVQEAVESKLGRPAVFNGVPGATDGTWLWKAGVPIVTIGAGNRFVPHQADEWVSLQQLVDMAVIYGEAGLRFLSAMSSLEKGGRP